MRIAAALIGVVWIAIAPAARQAPVDPFAFFRPAVTVTAEDRARIDRGEVVVRMLPAEDRGIGVFATLRVAVDGDRLVAWVRQIAQFLKSGPVLAVHRFSDPPTINDLRELALDDADLDAIRQCRAGDCGVKLSASEMIALQAAAGRAGAAWKPALEDAFRRLVVGRVEIYRAGGLAALPAYQDHDTGGSARRSAFAAILQRSPYLTERMPRLSEWLDRDPSMPMDGLESFVYWSTEEFGGKPIVSATRVGIVRNQGGGLPDVVAAGKQIFATHYMDGSLNLTMMLRGSGGEHYFVYVNRSEVDVLGGFWGGVRRMIIERRIKSDTADLLQGLRRRLESGEPAGG
jgi:hypothetical protein